MREIKFRSRTKEDDAKVKNYNERGIEHNGLWLYGGITDVEGFKVLTSHKGSLVNNKEKILEKFELFQNVVLADTIGQFTGLHDKNGKEIYEGDIVIFLNKSGEVVFTRGAFGIGFRQEINYDSINYFVENNKYYGCFNDNFISLWEIHWNFACVENEIKQIEVIGNIHDNPELLEVSND